MKYTSRQKEVTTLYENIKELIGTTPPPDLMDSVEIEALQTEGCRIGYNRSVTNEKTTELMDIEFDDGAMITLYSVNGHCTIDIIQNDNEDNAF